jgi:ABC-type multidrug transport system fused ATPase/permease subunit
MEPAFEAYQRRVAHYQAELAALDRQGSRLANLRVVTFLSFLGFGLAAGMNWLPRMAVLPAVVSLALYVALAVIHAKIIRREDFARARLHLNERGLMRLDGRWHQFSSTGVGRLVDGHRYAGDIDLAGPGSLFQRLDETGTEGGEAMLWAWLSEPSANAEALAARQHAVRELGPLVDFRQALVAEAQMANRKSKADPSRFIAWVEAPSSLAAIRWAWPIAHVLPIVTLSAGLLSANNVVSPWPFWVGLTLQIAIVFITRKPIAAMWEALSAGERGFVRFEETFKALDSQELKGARLVELQRGLTGGEPISSRLRRFARLLGFAELKHSGQMHPIVNALTLWDLLILFRIDKWKQTSGLGVRNWFEALFELEALSSLAAWHFERPEDVFPQIVPGDVRLEATQLGHPLLQRPVRNDVSFTVGQAWIITGSNMSGKTTLMRTTALNAVMALAGLPVCAHSMTISQVQLVTSMRVKDSLERGVSYFFAEVQRIKGILDQAQHHPHRCLFFLDELFMGTNTKERQVASRQILLMLLESGAAGAVTTHDLTLCELAAERPAAIRNVHFRDEMKNDEMTFDYRLREGIVQTTNALEVLRRAGVPVG